MTLVRRVRRLLLIPVSAVLLAAGAAAPGHATGLDWPDPATLGDMHGERLELRSSSPFTLRHAGHDEEAPNTKAQVRLFMPDEASADDPVPAVVMLHGAGGVLSARELTYGRQLAAMGTAAVVVDVFGARRDRAAGFVQRLLEITEAMFLADAFAALRYLDERPDVDASRTALVGFSYGGMVALYAAFAQVAERYAPDGLRFAGHVAYYAPCIAEFSDNRATGAPVLMLYGTRDAIVDPERCSTLADSLRDGGAEVEMIAYEGAYHQWDGWLGAPRKIGRNLAPCRLRVATSGRVYDRRTWLPMVDSMTRKAILALCSDEEGYMIGRDDAVRERSNADLGRFLSRLFAS